LAAIFIAAASATVFSEGSADDGAMLYDPTGNPYGVYKAVPTAGGNAVQGAGNAGVVPEPSTIALLCSAFGLALLRKRR
jgi:PEP-CTERM motif